MTELTKKNKKKIEQLQILEQNINTLLGQKQQIQSQIVENDSAIEEMDKSSTVYKIIGNIMVKSKKTELKKELQSKKERLELRTKAIEKQEKNLKNKASKIQKEVLKEIK
ncbi:prefoldin subunit beta [Candidatus Woesearchaeota archaeon]|nr:prefoldin subunit beta [Candidatus Woesearchaeota archaeon]